MSESLPGGDGDFWGDILPADPSTSAPLRLLRQQAELLTRKTGGRLRGVVEKNIENGYVWTSLYVEVPDLDDYRYKLVYFSHPVDHDPLNPFPMNVGMESDGIGTASLREMSQFETWLKQALSSKSARAVIFNLLQYSSPEPTASS